MIEIKGIDVVKGNRKIIEDVSFSIRPSQFTVVLGMNGAGKTTLLSAITSREKLSKGEIVWDRKRLYDFDLKDLAVRRAVLSQKFSLGFPMKVKELVEMGCYPIKRKISNIEKKELIHNALTEVGMRSFLNRDFISLSGGEQKRVLLAKCLVQLDDKCEQGDSKYLFLDEPTASIDIQHSFKILQLVKELTIKKGIGVFAILHDLNLAAQFADKIIILKNGRITHKGSPTEVFKETHIESSLGIKSIIQKHPLFGCPHITTLPS
ncbi:ATP-binding cassette domain-containing protein [Membranihabitans maritimus]|uniref:ATP-binding cassette domain-containing protein n=1 Tax=Membranihabitans maritimus TaxID=2904244 RepID=UPI001F01E4E4|nr:ATP-binding cassette domain-containing protein [Membranihabitans maritimus]